MCLTTPHRFIRQGKKSEKRESKTGKGAARLLGADGYIFLALPLRRISVGQRILRADCRRAVTAVR